MCRRQRDGAASRECLERRRGQRPALGRVGAAADFVEQHERPRPRAIEDLAQRGDVRRECRQAGGDGLAVADIGKDTLEYGQR